MYEFVGSYTMYTILIIINSHWSEKMCDLKLCEHIYFSCLLELSQISRDEFRFYDILYVTFYRDLRDESVI